jgi:lipid-A-disaccharide synthase
MDIVIVAGETSGDQLAAHLVNQLRAANPSLRFHGIAGPKMRAAGVVEWFDAQALAVRGYGEVLTALPRILRIKRALIEKVNALRPALYIGVDAPDFNLRIERALKADAAHTGIRTMHYVCPSFWAWRPERAATFAQSVDHMLCVFPFEPALLAPHQVPATFVGHPLATAPLVNVDRETLRSKLEHYAEGATDPIVAILPGSRISELHYHAVLFVQAMKLLVDEFPAMRFVVPLVTRETREIFERALWQHAEALAPRVQLLFGHADFALRVADAAIVASGTATLEAAMLDCPQVVSYRISAFTHAIVKRKIRLPYVSLPNILARDWVVPELLQKNATAPALAAAVAELIYHPDKRKAMTAHYARIRSDLSLPEGATPAVDAVLHLLQQR